MFNLQTMVFIMFPSCVLHVFIHFHPIPPVKFQRPPGHRLHAPAAQTGSRHLLQRQWHGSGAWCRRSRSGARLAWHGVTIHHATMVTMPTSRIMAWSYDHPTSVIVNRKCQVGWHANAMYFVHRCSLCQQELLTTRPPKKNCSKEYDRMNQPSQSTPFFPLRPAWSIGTVPGSCHMSPPFICPLLNTWLAGRFWAHWTDDQLSFGALPSLACQQKSQKIAVLPDSIN